MKRIALVLLSDYSKSWIDSGNLAQLSKESELTVYGSPAVIRKIESLGLNLLNQELPEIEASRTTRLLQLVSLINRRSLSTSFDFRLKRLIFGELRLSPKVKKTRTIPHALKYNLKRLGVFILTHPLETIAFFPPLGQFLEARLRAHFEKSSQEKFKNLTFDWSYDLVVLPSAAIEDRIYEFVQFLKHTSAKSAICIENWDNLTSKSILISKPDFVFVMGQFCKNHGEKIQSFNPSQIIVAGLPRFNPYRTLHPEVSSITAKRTFKILYLGFSVPHNERNLINQLISLIDSSEMSGRYEFFYKPHPVRQPRFYESSWMPPNVKVIENKSGLTGFAAIPAINASHFQDILDASVVIATPTSMAIESMLLKVPTIIDATDDEVHRTTAKNSLNSYLHLRDLKKIEGVLFGGTAEEIFNEILSHFLGMASTERPLLDDLIESKDSSYVSHIINLASRL